MNPRSAFCVVLVLTENIKGVEEWPFYASLTEMIMLTTIRSRIVFSFHYSAGLLHCLGLFRMQRMLIRDKYAITDAVKV
jgi:hypothetical protein